MAQWVKNLPAVLEMQETQVESLGWEDALDEGMATHSSILAWRIPWTEESCGLQSIGLQELDTIGATEHTHMLPSSISLLYNHCSCLSNKNETSWIIYFYLICFSQSQNKIGLILKMRTEEIEA